MKKCALIVIVESHTAALHAAVPNNNNIIASTSRAAFCVPNNRLYYIRVYYSNNNNVIYEYVLNEFLNLKSERFIRLRRVGRFNIAAAESNFIYIIMAGTIVVIYLCSGDN